MVRGRRIEALLAAIAIGAVVVAWRADAEPQPAPSVTAVAEPSVPSAAPTPLPSPTPTLAPPLAWGPAASEWDAALADAQALAVEQAAGQVIMVSLDSAAVKPATALVRDRHLAGVLLLGGAVVDGAQVTSLNGYLAGAGGDRDWPVMIATDEEGGLVQRLRPAIGYVSAFMAAGANPDADQTRAYYTGLGTQLAALGFTMDMAPVADVTVGLGDPTIRTRSAGSDPLVVDRAVAAAWAGLDAGGVTPVVKHFPGHGSVAVDSHTGLPHQTATISELARRDFVPFADAISAGAPSVMMGHIQVAEWGEAPATVNSLAYAYLRDDLGFDGLIMTDAMNMEAITDLYAPGAATVAALNAGADLVLMPADLDAAIAGIEAAVADGSLPRARLDDAAAHVILLARYQARDHEAFPAARPKDFVEGSVAVASLDCAALIGPTVQISGGTASQRALLARALVARGVSVGSKGTAIALVNGDTGHADATVVVALGGPWGLPASSAHTYVAAWGEGEEQMAAVAAVLAGDVTPRGTWPVSLKLSAPACAT